MCEFCKKNGFGENINTKTGHWFLYREKTSAIYYQHGNSKNACGLPINYCPICGRKLSEVAENECK